MTVSSKIAVIGAGVSGLVAAYVLGQRHQVTVFEEKALPGGHAHTALLEDQGRKLAIDTGFIVFNTLNYPLLCRLFDMLDVRSHASDMSFSVHCEQSGFEYNGANLNKIFSQRHNLFRPAVWRMLLDILRFNKEARCRLNQTLSDDVTVGDFLSREHYSDSFLQRYLLPLGASIWSCDTAGFRRFPIRFVIEFLNNHSLLQLGGRPQWRTVTGSSRKYVEKLQNHLGERLRLGTSVHRVERQPHSVVVHWNNGQRETFDEVVMATHADTSMRTVADLDEEEIDVLGYFPYQENQACLHTDTRVLPKRKRTWASWNYRIPATDQQAVSVTYNINLLQGIDTPRTYCVSLNQNDSIDARQVIRSMRYRHPLFLPGRDIAQRNHAALLRRRGISYCGAYWGYGFHEDGVRSALSVCDAFEVEAPF